MSPGKINKKIILDRIDLIEKMIKEIQALPLNSYKKFMEDRRTVWAAESCLRRSLESLLDTGRHILAKGFGIGVSEYKEIAYKLGENNVFSKENVLLLKILAGYRNRLVHFYAEVTEEELYNICKNEINDIIKIKEAYIDWLKMHSEILDETL